MISAKNRDIYYTALLSKNIKYDGVFYVGVKTTGVFCRPTCPARKPKLINCEFFQTAESALLASYRPCKRCQPLSYPQQIHPTIKILIDAIENSPEKRWRTSDFKKLSIDESTARRQFIDAQISIGYESSSGFRDAFSRIMGDAPTKYSGNILQATWIDTKLGAMIAIANEQAIYLLEFVNRRGLEREIEKLRHRTKSAIIPGKNAQIDLLETELKQYFAGKLANFTVPICLIGSEFQKQVWAELKKIPIGQTCSYSDIAIAIKKPTAFRAVANANGCNQLAIIIPCHRVINQNGNIGGYGGGVARKEWLLNLERQYKGEKICLIK
jgi:AraC family transcriptional regulator of adaptative response/methylated-DNA-[protein]-cysteine methyltransferase